MSTYNTLVHGVQGGARLDVESGGKIDILSGGELEISSGATFDIDAGMDIDGAIQLDNTLTVGVNDAGYDVKFFGATSGSYVLWDESGDELVFEAARLRLGTLSSSTQTGVALTAAKSSVLDSFADDNNVTLTNAVYTNIRARTMLFKSATGVTIVSARGQIKSADAVDFGPGVYAGVQGYMELVDESDVQSGAKYWGVDSSIDVPSGGTIDVKSGGIAAGLHAELTGAGTATQSSGGILAGLYVDEQITTGTWGYGVYVTGATEGVYVGGAATRGLHVTTSMAAPNLGDGYGGGAEVEITTTGAAAGHVAAASAWVNVNGTVAAGGQMICARTDGIYVNTGGSGDMTNGYAIYGARMQAINTATASYIAPFSINVSGDTTDAIFFIYNGNGANELGYTVDATEDDGKIGAVPLFIDGNTGTQYWVRVYSGAS